MAKHNGRKLIWWYHRSKAEVVTKYLKNRYCFTVSMYQLAILMLFNQKDSYRVSELVEQTKLKSDLVSQLLQIFLKARILKTDAKEALNDSSVVSLFENYNNKKLRLNLNIPLKVEQKQEQEQNDKTINDGRKYIIQAAIVRIMKTRRKLNYQEILSEVLSQLSNKFKPSIPMIKVHNS